MKKTPTRDIAISTVVRENDRPLRAFVQSRTRDSNETDDVVQEAFTELVTAYDLNTAIENAGAWLVRVARNKILDRFRRRRTRETFAKDTGEDLSESAAGVTSSPVAGPDAEWSRKWLRERIAEALERLPPEQREVFIMHELEGKTFEEIAAALNQNLNTLLARKRYAIRFLQNELKEIYDELE